MGVTGLWTVLHPVARPIKLETLSQKRLAIDASIWIYQFLKAVRDKEGNALRNSHVVGFFRRICKLLFLGIKPVFVFDGGAPALKRQTINARKRRREGRREDAVRTAGKLLAVQMQRRAEEEEKRRKEELERGSAAVEEAVPENIVYAEEVSLATNQIQQTRKFRKKDQYHLPNLDVSLTDMGQPNDPRIMSLEELENYARQFDAGEDINVYDFSKIDFDGPFFMSLPAGDRYNILNAARLRSRLRMGHSKEQLDAMFPDRMAFSKFQIERVAERNELTQRLMNINGMNDGVGFGQSRISSEKGREYVLVKNDGVEGGWALGVVSGNKDVGKQEKPIDIDELDRRRQKEEEESDEEDWDEDEFEDVPIEGLNRLPRLPSGQTNGISERASKNAERRRALYRARKNNRPQNRRPAKPRAPVEEADALFVADEDEEAETWEDVDVDLVANGDGDDQEMVDPEDEELQRAIAMSLEQHGASEDEANSEDDEYREVFQQERVEEARPFARGKGMTIAHAANARSNKAAPKAAATNGSDDDEELDLQAALAESRRSKHSPKPRRKETVPPAKSTTTAAKSSSAPSHPFDGPLPFEKLDLGSSLLGKKKMKKLTEEAEGGFDKEEAAAERKKESKPLPPWFAGNIEEGISAAKAQEKEDRERERRLEEEQEEFEFSKPRLRRNETNDVIDLDDEEKPVVIDLDDDKVAPEKMTIEIEDDEADSRTEQTQPEATRVGTSEVPNMGVLADHIRAEPPQPFVTSSHAAESAPTQHRDANGMEQPEDRDPALQLNEDDSDEPLDWEDSDNEATTTRQTAKAAPVASDPSLVTKTPFMDSSSEGEGDDFEDVEINPNDTTKSPPEKQNGVAVHPAGGAMKKGPFAESSPEPDDEEETFEDVIENKLNDDQPPVQDSQIQPELTNDQRIDESEELETSHAPLTPPRTSGLVAQELPIEDMSPQDADQDASELIYSDPEDEEMFRALIAEENEHARFASELNNRSVQQNMRDYENELKQLRNQQKKDRRDADEVTQAMITECQQLLGLFGLPYITAPMEAEAQCAELVKLGLVDGIVTDDSDCFLFGGTRVYKNMFNQAKFVECYLSSDLEAEFGMTRQRLIALAQLLGSDYTEGLPGVGPVSAVELVGEFDSLETFKNWWDQVQSGKLPKSADTSKFRTKFRKSQGTKLFLPPSFPDPRVEMAYLQPEVDSDPSAFQWGVPDLNALRSFLMATIGWGPERTDEILVPVIRDMNTRQSEGVQRNITSFFGGTIGAGAFAPRVREAGSSRLQSALHRIGERSRRSDGNEVVVEETAGTDAAEPAAGKKSTVGRKKGVKRSKAATNDAENGHDDTEGSADETSKKKARKSTKKRGKKTVAEDDD